DVKGSRRHRGRATVSVSAGKDEFTEAHLGQVVDAIRVVDDAADGQVGIARHANGHVAAEGGRAPQDHVAGPAVVAVDVVQRAQAADPRVVEDEQFVAHRKAG